MNNIIDKINRHLISQKKIEPIEIKKTVNVEFTEDSTNTILYLNRQISDIEWSGVAICSVDVPFFQSEKEVNVTVCDIIPLDIGDAASTKYDYSELLPQFLITNSTAQNLFRRGKLKLALIHSHHTMNVFFSGEDEDELKQNHIYHDWYLSIIVNNKGETCAKIAFAIESIAKTMLLSNGEKIESLQSNCMGVIDCNIEPLQIVFQGADEIKFQVAILKEKKKEKELQKNKKLFPMSNTADYMDKYEPSLFPDDFN